MQFDQGFVEQVRSSIGIVELVSNYVSLKKSGQNHAGLCPFHSEKTPSFLVSESKQIFKCFGCGEGGDIFKFVSLMENLTFPEAVRSLAERAGIPLPVEKRTNVAEESRRSTLLGLMRVAQEFYVDCLTRPAGAHARAYLEDRGINAASIGSFGIGYAPPGNALMRHLRKQGVQLDDALTCGLIKKSDSGSLYDSFRDRIMFPIRDLSGNPIALGGRILGQGIPKYLNSQETPLYNKSSNLFGLDLSRSAIRDSGFAILVEGYFDCVIPHQYGFQNVVASLGTSLTSQQVRILGRYTRKVVINFDPDSAGMTAAVRSIEIFLRQGFRVNILALPHGADPDTFIRENGEAEYQQRLRKSSGCIDFILERFVAQHPNPYSPRGKQEVIEQIVSFLNLMPDAIERAEYVSRVASKMKIAEELVRQEMRKKPMGAGKAQEEKPRDMRLAELTWAETAVLAAVLEPRFAQQAISMTCLEFFEDLASRGIFEKVFHLWELKQEINILYLRDLLENEYDRDLLESVGIQVADLTLTAEELRESVKVLRRKHFERLSRQVQDEIDSEEQADPQSSRIGELLLKKEELRRRIELEQQ